MSFWRLLENKPFWGGCVTLPMLFRKNCREQLSLRCIILVKERENDRNGSNWKYCLYLSNYLLWIPLHLVYLGARWLWEAGTGQIWPGRGARADTHHSAASVQPPKGRTFRHSGYSHCFREGNFGSQALYASSETRNGEKKHWETATQSCCCPYLGENASIPAILLLHHRSWCRVWKSVIIFSPTFSKKKKIWDVLYLV